VTIVRAGGSPTTVNPPRTQAQDSPNLDCLRSFAVLAVFVDHLLATVGVEQIGGITLWELGRLGVLMFFVHTSLVLMMSMERMRLTGMKMVGSFAIRRIFRIYPLSIAFVALVLLFSIPATPWRVGFEHFSRLDIASNFLLTQNLTYSPSVIGALWSLPYELQMYALLPLIFFALRKYAPVRTALAIWVFGLLAALIQPRIAGRLDVAQFAPCFLSGVLAYVLLPRLQPRFRAWMWPPFILLLTPAFLAMGDPSQKSPSRGWFFCLALGLAIPWFHELKSPVWNKLYLWIARYSYGIYIAHLPVFWFSFRFLKGYPAGVQWLSMAVLSVLVPVACYHWIEAPLMRLGKQVAERHFPTRRAAEPVPVVA